MVPDNNKELKKRLRSNIREQLVKQSSSLREERSLKIEKELISGADFKNAHCIMTYVALSEEVDTSLINKEALEKGKKVVVPFIDKNTMLIPVELRSIDNLVEGAYGIKVPSDTVKCDLKDIDLVIVPAVAFDENKMRLGRGKGYYDRFLSDKSIKNAVTIGLAFSFQIVKNMPFDPHDRPVLKVITD